MTISLTEESLGLVLENDDIQTASEEISSDILSRKVDFIQFIECLGFALKSTTIELRAKATKLLSETLNRLPVDFFNSTELNFISVFYCDRLKDHHSVLPGVLSGMLTIARMKHVPEGASSKMLQALFFNVPCQSQTWDDRQKYFHILRTLAENQTKELLAMKADFVYGVINAIDGERDPRLLMEIFDFLPMFIKTFPLHHLTEEMFEICACYFPIDFFPAADDPKAITRESLAEKLSQCLCASPEFADNCIELCIDKMDSQLKAAKLDSLQLLTKSANAFYPNDLEKNFQSIWAALKIELIPDTNKDFALAALKALETILSTTSSDTNLCKNILTIVFETISMHFGDAGARNFAPAITVALSCAKSCSFAAAEVSGKVIPVILELIKSNDGNINQQCHLLEIATHFVAICNKHKVDIDANTIQSIHRELIDSITVNSTNQGTFKIGLKSIAQIAETFPGHHRFTIYEIISNNLLQSKMIPEILNLFTILAEAYPFEIVTEVIDITTYNTLNVQNSDYIFTALCSVVHIAEIGNLAFKILLQNACNQSIIQLIALRNIRKLFEQHLSLEIWNNLIEYFHIVDETFKIAQQYTAQQSDYNVLEEISKILGLIIRNLNGTQQTNLILTYLPKIQFENASDLYVSVGLLNYLDKDFEFDYLNTVIHKLTVTSIHSGDAKLVAISNQLLCSLFNKLSEKKLYKNEMEKTVEMTQIQISMENVQAIRTLAWIIKGMLVRGHPDAVRLIYLCLDLLENNSLSQSVPEAFEIIASNASNIDLPVTSFLYKQKCFQIVLSKLWPNLKTFSNDHFAVLAYVFRSTPYQVLTINIDKVATILFKSLGLNSITSVLISLQIIQKFIKDRSSYFQDHLQHLIPTFVKLCKHKESMKIRIISIECLGAMCFSYPAVTLVPHKYDVVYGLSSPLDDNKRLVRNAAVQARNRWFTLEMDSTK